VKPLQKHAHIATKTKLSPPFTGTPKQCKKIENNNHNHNNNEKIYDIIKINKELSYPCFSEISLQIFLRQTM